MAKSDKKPFLKTDIEMQDKFSNLFPDLDVGVRTTPDNPQLAENRINHYHDETMITKSGIEFKYDGYSNVWNETGMYIEASHLEFLKAWESKTGIPRIDLVRELCKWMQDIANRHPDYPKMKVFGIARRKMYMKLKSEIKRDVELGYPPIKFDPIIAKSPENHYIKPISKISDQWDKSKQFKNPTLPIAFTDPPFNNSVARITELQDESMESVARKSDLEHWKKKYYDEVDKMVHNGAMTHPVKPESFMDNLDSQFAKWDKNIKTGKGKKVLEPNLEKAMDELDAFYDNWEEFDNDIIKPVKISFFKKILQAIKKLLKKLKWW